MALVVQVPLNTAIADLDEALRLLLKRELEQHGFEGVDIAFEAPSKEWSGKLTRPTVSLFLYDLREDAEGREMGSSEKRSNGGVIESKPPMRLQLTYAVTVWTKAVQDEHRLLSQVLAILFSYKIIPPEILGEVPDGGSSLKEIRTTVGRPREEGADFWTAVGGQYKASIDFTVRLRVDSGAVITRGPQVRMQTLRTQMIDGPARLLEEFHRFGGTVRGPDDQPIANAWVAMPDLGLWSSTNREGRFIFTRIPTGPHRVLARTADGSETSETVTLPGAHADLVIGAKAKSRK